jgi:flagellar hook-basal body complex protein FliE
MSIEGIGAINPSIALSGATGITRLGGSTPAASETSSATDFASVLSGGLEKLQATQSRADGLAVQAANGSLTDVHDYMIASTEASLATQLTVAVRNKALDAFNEIMRMQA